MKDAKTHKIVDKFEDDIIFKIFRKYLQKKSDPSTTEYYITVIYGKQKFNTNSFKLVSGSRYISKYTKKEEPKKRSGTLIENKKYSKLELEKETDSNSHKVKSITIDLKNIPVT